MKIAVVTFDGFNEIDSFVAAHILNRVARAGWKAEITAPAEFVASLNGVRVAAQRPLDRRKNTSRAPSSSCRNLLLKSG